MQNISQDQLVNPTFQVKSEDGAIVIEPLEQGYGHTLGNSLRRTLLTSLPGSAITQVRIKGVDHQFTTLEGMREDIVELILNLKLVRVQSAAFKEGVAHIKVKGPKIVKASDIVCDADFEVVNPDQQIATLEKGKSLDVELVVESGVGYRVAQETKTSTIGEIPVDALFSPVVKVSYKVEATRVGRKTDFDKLILNIKTDDSLTPMEAVQQAARILSKQFAQIYQPTVAEPEKKETRLTPEELETLNLTVEELDLPTRIANALRKGGFETVGDLKGAHPGVVAKVKNLGEKSVSVIRKALNKKGVDLGE